MYYLPCIQFCYSFWTICFSCSFATLLQSRNYFAYNTTKLQLPFNSPFLRMLRVKYFHLIFKCLTSFYFCAYKYSRRRAQTHLSFNDKQINCLEGSKWKVLRYCRGFHQEMQNNSRVIHWQQSWEAARNPGHKPLVQLYLLASKQSGCISVILYGFSARKVL